MKKEASQMRDYVRRKNRDVSRGSPRSLAAQKALARDDNQTVGYRRRTAASRLRMA
jgi:hypothetical protein